jgi:hypothetical protein
MARTVNTGRVLPVFVVKDSKADDSGSIPLLEYTFDCSVGRKTI